MRSPLGFDYHSPLILTTNRISLNFRFLILQINFKVNKKLILRKFFGRVTEKMLTKNAKSNVK